METMRLFVSVVVLVVPLVAGEYCYPTKAESYGKSSVTKENIYMATDYDNGMVYTTANDSWTLYDLEYSLVYYTDRDGKCFYEDLEDEDAELVKQCLPANAQMVDTKDGDEYLSLPSPVGVETTVAVTPIVGSQYYHRRMTKVVVRGEVDEDIVYTKVNEGVSDQSVFEKDLDDCADAWTARR